MGKPKLCTCEARPKTHSVRSGNVKKGYRGIEIKKSPFKRLVDGGRKKKNGSNQNKSGLVTSNNTGPDKIGRLLDSCEGKYYKKISQEKKKEKSVKKDPCTGHPRKHVSQPDTDNGVEKYSESDKYGKTGFFTRKAQDSWTSQAINSQEGRDSFNHFNSDKSENPGDKKSTITYFPGDTSTRPVEVCGHWFNGQLEEIFMPQGMAVTYTDIGGHLKEEQVFREFDVFIVSAYPLGSDFACYKRIQGGFDEKGNFREKNLLEIHDPQLSQECGTGKGQPKCPSPCPPKKPVPPEKPGPPKKPDPPKRPCPPKRNNNNK